MTELTGDRPGSARNATQITVRISNPTEAQELLDSVLRNLDAIEEGSLYLSTAGSGETTTITVGGLTRKQRQAVQTAVGLGYYADPRSATLGEVAAELDISDSGASSRLRTVERKLVVALADQLEATATPG